MPDAMWLYLFTRVDSLRELSIFILVISMIVGVVLFICWACSKFEVDYNTGDFAKKVERLPLGKIRNVLIFIAALSVLLPSQKDIAIIVGGTLAVEASKSETAKKVLLLVNEVLDKEIASLKNKEKK